MFVYDVARDELISSAIAWDTDIRIRVVEAGYAYPVQSDSNPTLASLTALNGSYTGELCTSGVLQNRSVDTVGDVKTYKASHVATNTSVGGVAHTPSIVIIYKYNFDDAYARLIAVYDVANYGDLDATAATQLPADEAPTMRWRNNIAFSIDSSVPSFSPGNGSITAVLASSVTSPIVYDQGIGAVRGSPATRWNHLNAPGARAYLLPGSYVLPGPKGAADVLYWADWNVGFTGITPQSEALGGPRQVIANAPYALDSVTIPAAEITEPITVAAVVIVTDYSEALVVVPASASLTPGSDATLDFLDGVDTTHQYVDGNTPAASFLSVYSLSQSGPETIVPLSPVVGTQDAQPQPIMLGTIDVQMTVAAPVLDAEFTVTSDTRGPIEAVFPMLEVAMTGGLGNRIEVVFDKLEVSLQAETLPVYEAFMEVVFPALQTDILRTYNEFDVQVPVLATSFTATPGVPVTLDIKFKPLDADLESYASKTATLDVKLPALATGLSSVQGQVGELEINLPPLSIATEAWPVISGSIDCALTALETDITTAQGINATVALVFPKIALDVEAAGDVNGYVTTYVVNTRTFALTEYSAHNFTSMAKHKDACYGTSAYGLHRLGSRDGDVAEVDGVMTDVSGKWGTGLVDFGSTLQKRVADIYLWALSDTEATVTVNADESAEYEYQMPYSPGAPHRAKPGGGLRGRRWRFVFNKTTPFAAANAEVNIAETDRRV